MKHTSYIPLPRPEGYVDRITVAAPLSFGRAVRTAAAREGLTVADFARLALGERAAQVGVQCPSLPITSSSEFFRKAR